MKFSLKTSSGKPDLPVVLLIHGLGMNNYFWVDPQKCHVLGGLAPLTIFLADAPEQTKNTISFGTVNPDIRGLWDCLENEGFPLASWSQRQSLGPVRLAIDELKAALTNVRNIWPGRPVYLVAHSRGGLIARHYLQEEGADDIAGLVTICSPHSGTNMAKFSRYLKPAGVFLEKIIPDGSRAMLTKALGRISTFFRSPAIGELTPDAEFIASLAEPLPEKLRLLSFGGTSPSLFQLVVRLPVGKQKIIKFPDMLCRAVPAEHLPEELAPGLGDALVSARSACLPGGHHYDFPDNHVRAAYDQKIHRLIIDFLKG
jgi:pimeloyl-ACP methyl ester carboxylesterase